MMRCGLSAFVVLDVYGRILATSYYAMAVAYSLILVMLSVHRADEINKS
ncbi:hypothetical protein EIO_2980 (plasmid) [Ketogulonicigenium vulgare Y25]|uniref:Uncharacterized protein n=1 Tax=Ketogulonicigenium vulgare (strain WSH-001) TaxID=759362 RepID=F9YB22_KETVW|nr:hypothetical protein EIO_2980 [Ketogulonicigenium vulgare Y25]AEM42574.1 hypothetical protein KVU_PA0155 [Ketogulonicigenium vulgare WSH-001]ALJ82604.1 hypothetical protein KVH_15000 [Ketogulonicigenium vulgare]ANW35444.1 hypothetical protein KvSKV_14890 [Ketogulonicigenium vulgare]